MGAEGAGWETHHLGETGHSGAVVVEDALGSDDGDIAGTLDDDRTRIQTIVTDPSALIRCQVMSASQNTIDEDLDLGIDHADIPETQLGVVLDVVVNRE